MTQNHSSRRPDRQDHSSFADVLSEQEEESSFSTRSHHHHSPRRSDLQDGSSFADVLSEQEEESSFSTRSHHHHSPRRSDPQDGSSFADVLSEQEEESSHSTRSHHHHHHHSSRRSALQDGSFHADVLSEQEEESSFSTRSHSHSSRRFAYQNNSSRKLKSFTSSIFSLKNICLFLVVLFYIGKTYRYSLSTTEVQGGFWNIAQVFLVILGVKIACSNFKNFKSSKAFLFIWSYCLFTFVSATFELQYETSYIFAWLTALYPASIFTIFYHMGFKGNIVRKDLVDVAFYAMVFMCGYSYLMENVFDGARTYLFLGLLPVVIMRCSKSTQFIPILVCALPVFFSAKRGGFLAYLLMTLVFFFNEFRRGKDALQITRLLFFFTIVFVGLVYSFNFVTANSSNLTRQLEKMEEGNTSGRLERWEAVAKYFVHSSVVDEIFGNGYFAIQQGKGYLGLKMHNDYLEVLYRFGIIGLGLYLAFIISLFGVFFKTLRFRYQYSIFMALAFIYSFFMSTFSFYITAIEFITSGMICFGLLLGNFQRLCLTSKNNRQTALRTFSVYRRKKD